MSDAWRMRFDRWSFWNKVGLLICVREGVVYFGDLNPETSFCYKMSRWERCKLGLWFLLQAVQPERDAEDE